MNTLLNTRCITKDEFLAKIGSQRSFHIDVKGIGPVLIAQLLMATILPTETVSEARLAQFSRIGELVHIATNHTTQGTAEYTVVVSTDRQSSYVFSSYIDAMQAIKAKDTRLTIFLGEFQLTRCNVLFIL